MALNGARSRDWLPLLAVSVVLALWIGWLRAPSIGVTMWNVDEAIHAAVARTLLEGGVMYRDAVDQRSPLTYYAFAAIFQFAGMNNLAAVRVVIAGMIVLTALLLFITGRRIRNVTMGLFAAFIYAALTSHLLFVGDLYAAHTEWFVALFTMGGSALFLTSGGCPSNQRSFGIGACFALAFLSKQPALTDLGAPIGTLIYLGAFRAYPWRQVTLALASTVAGFAVITGSVILLLVAAGAGPAMLFYTWTYNLAYYGPEIDWGTRLLSPAPFFAQLLHLYPLALLAAVASAVAIAVRLVQLRPSLPLVATRSTDCFLLLWCVTSLIGAMSGGRGYDHYFFQCLPSFALMAAWAPGLIASGWSARRSSLFATAGLWIGALAAGIMALGLLWVPPRGRAVTPPPLDPALTVAAFIREHSLPSDKIFAWGFNPDIYMYADRSPASRFVYCSFQTGLIPWTNEDPAIDTAYAIVPGSMETLLADLAKNRPVFIVDCGVGPHRRFTKYPLNNFPALRTYAEQHYVEVNPRHFLPYGFRLLMLRDPNPETLPLAGTANAVTPPTPDPRGPILLGPTRVGVGASLFTVNAESTKPELQRLALYLDGREVAAVHFPPATSMNIRVPVSFDVAAASSAHVLQAKLTTASGAQLLSDPREITVLPLDTSPEQQTVFALPRIDGAIKAEGVRALFDPRVEVTDGIRTFALHAPSLLSYSVPPEIRVVRGKFGIPPGAYAADNRGPSDGAGFIIRLVTTDGKTRVLLDRVLNPTHNPSDRPTQSFHLQLGELIAPARLEFEITSGPSGNAASDWTFWSDITLETSL